MEDKNCTNCRWFLSFKDDYEDELEPDDLGFCENPESEVGNGAGYHTKCSLYE